MSKFSPGMIVLLLISLMMANPANAQSEHNTGMANVLEDLERRLIEIADSPSKLSSTEFAEFHRRLDTDDMLFKIKVVGSQVRLKEQESARAIAGTHS